MHFMDFQTELEQADIVILPIPHEQTTSYGKGTKLGPEAILKASHELENYNIETDSEPYKGIYTEKPTKITEIKQYPNKFIIALGGEHSITPNKIKTLKQENLSILHIDAHADLKDEFDGSKDSHACAMRRTFEINPNIVQVGIRSQSKEEKDFAQNNNIKQLNITDNILENLKENVYISLDLDVFDPKEMPAVGTPEPDGLTFKEVKELLKQIITNKNVIAMDVVELSPKENDLISPYSTAKLIYNCIAYKNQMFSKQ